MAPVFRSGRGGPLIVLHGFRYGEDGCNRTDGGYPSARLIDVSDMLYGTDAAAEAPTRWHGL